PSAPDYDNVLSPPTLAHLFGTDSYGRDILSRVIWGGRISLSVGFISGVVGVALGLLSGFLGGWVDSLIMRGADVLFAFPGLLLALAVVAVLGPGISNRCWATAGSVVSR